ncbi:28S ribosomal protein S7, mitochondrial-like [Centruroides sculpturatus]|uniref:28S ribosomal protein S7, mitochondrial-like n=1 Tax=Centruroides sculpturatus TaxID=218467 RepID=UPI000C6ED298|nr:28S ribosomal protein S7, mitochondrial-like [Centruroides sculpturatus]
MALKRVNAYFRKEFLNWFSNFNSVNSVRWNRYPPIYIDPIYDKDYQKELKEEGKLSELAFRPVKAATNYETSSVFYDPLKHKFINSIMKYSNKVLARELLDETFTRIKRIQLEKYHSAKEESRDSIECDPLKILYRAVENSTPIVILTAVKRGGINYRVPTPLKPSKGTFYGMKWLVMAGKEKDRKIRFTEQLAKELIDASNNTGKVVKKKQDIHRNCEANKAYAHYRWS